MTNVNAITSGAWQISTGELGEIAQDVADISQAIGIILNTVPGSDPLRPDFGSYLFLYISGPINQAAASIKKAITFDVEKWEPRVKVSKVDVKIGAVSELKITVSWRLIAGNITGTGYYSYTPTGATISQPPTISFVNPATSGVSSTVDWQISLDAFGSTVEGANEISQAIVIAITNIPGTDLIRPLFGGAIFEHVDKPLPVAAAPISQAIRAAVDIWEPRAEITKLSFAYQSQPNESYYTGIIYRIAWKLRGTDVQGQTDLLLQTQNQGTQSAPPTVIIRILATENGEAITSEAGAFIQI